MVVERNQFAEGDLVVFFEPDSLLPTTPPFQLLAKYGTKKSIVNNKEYVGYRLKTVRLRGQVSQGLCLPPAALGLDKDIAVGADVSAVLGVVKYEAPIPASLAGVIKGEFPSFIPKSDEPRIQSFPDKLGQYASTTFYATEKIDGTSVTFFLHDGELNVCSRNLNLKETEGNSYWRLAKDLGMKEKLHALGGDIALQGELVGEGINKNRLKVKGQKVFFFTGYNIAKGEYLSFKELMEVCKAAGVETVPVISTDFKLPATVDELVAYATRKSVIAPDVMEEGVVFRPLEEIRDPDIGRLSFKVLNPEYLLKYEE